MIRNLVIDLDGPILDGRQRHYWCYKEILESFGARALSIDEYWAQKRERVHASDILAASGAAARYEDFHRTWSAQIELPEALGRDRVQAGARETLSLWHNRRLRIVVATLRRNKRNLYDQLDALGLSSFFNDVVPCDYESGDQGKAESVKALAGIEPHESVWIGDTELDILAARRFGAPCVALSCGLRSERVLRAFSPDVILKQLSEVPTIEPELELLLSPHR